MKLSSFLMWLFAINAVFMIAVFFRSNAYAGSTSPVGGTRDVWGNNQWRQFGVKGLNGLDNSDVSNLENEFTFVFAIFNINRKAHLGLEGEAYKFEDDYVARLCTILDWMKPLPVRVIIQKQYYHLLEPHLWNRTNVILREIDDLRSFKYYKQIERIRNSPWWLKKTGWLRDVPQGYSDLYNPIVMQKVLWLQELAHDNPFNTKYFVWLDSGGICTPQVYNFGKQKFLQKLKYFMDKFLITLSLYAGSEEIHGCQRSLIMKLTYGLQPAFVTKGWLMGGTRQSIDDVVEVYNDMLNKTLEMGCLGTEETIFTIMQYSHPQLFHLHYNGDPFAPWEANFCEFLNPHRQYIIPEVLEQEEWIAENPL
mmetsp:Transcript_20466/g.28705  ORF Transcript_20466/g.28705 Transcript_20466/m.28705 type:complete len:365 (+) Transcript_20466:160-1254(+)